MPILINNEWAEKIPIDKFSLLSSGQGLFETILFEDGILWFWERHEQRLLSSLAFFRIENIAFDLKEFVLAYLKEIDTGQPLRIKLICLFPFDKPPKSVSRNNIVLQIDIAEKTSNKARPLTLMTIPLPNAPHNPLTGHKTLAYTHFMYARKLAVENGFDDVLFYNQNNLVLETSYSNIFAVKGNQLFTPKCSAGILPGTIRSLLVKELEAREIDIQLHSIRKYDYFFVTSSIKGLHTINKIDQSRFKINNDRFELIKANYLSIKLNYKKSINSK